VHTPEVIKESLSRLTRQPDAITPVDTRYEEHPGTRGAGEAEETKQDVGEGEEAKYDVAPLPDEPDPHEKQTQPSTNDVASLPDEII